ncbi:MAG TPA: hypothetical protein VKB93_29615, partial [Thermoanaerobaculia bacterium]|nr:hypothetical protein [Thermoanaerobaculia bacterium]
GDVNGDGIDDLIVHDGIRTKFFFGTPTGLVQHPQVYSAGSPLIVRNALELPSIVYAISPGEAGLIENACRPTSRRRGARH